MRFGSFVLAVAVATAAPAFAQETQPPAAAAAQPEQDPIKRFEAYATSEGYRRTMGQLAAVGDSISAPECKDRKAVARAALTVFLPPVFAEGLHPVSGLWQDRIRMDRCGKTTYQNLLIQAQPGGAPPRVALKMPGLTNANPLMQDLVMKDVLQGLADRKCTDSTQIIPLDSVLGKETKPRKVDDKGTLTEGAWKETWTFRACGKDVGIGVDFTADGKGGLNHKVNLQ